jgi:hypothetical protein
MLVVLLTVGAGLVGCRGRTFEAPKQAHDPMLEKLKQPPLNTPWNASPKRDPDNRRQPAPRSNDQPGVWVFSDGRFVTSNLILSGRAAHNNGAIDFVTDQGKTLQIQYRLPRQMGPLPQLTATASLAVLDRSNPGGPAKRVMVTVGALPLLGEMWQKSATPIVVDLGAGLQVRQTPVSIEGIHNVPVEIVQNQDVRPIAVGTVTTVKTALGVFQSFVAESYFADSSDTTHQFPGGYVIHVWIARAGS